MKYLVIISLLLLFGCQKQDYSVVRYSVYHSGYGELEYKFDDGECKKIENNTFDTVFLVPLVNDYEHKYNIELWHYNDGISEIKAQIEVDGVAVKTLDRQFKSCYTIQTILTY